MPANDRQVGGNHYKGAKLEHWDVVWMFSLDYFQGQITKYVFRWRDKGGIVDLEKGLHFYEKYLECVKGNSMEADNDIEQMVEIIPYPMVKPTGWWGFTFEGTDGKGSLYTCQKCKENVYAKPDFFPGDFHTCSVGEVDAAYLNQGREPAG
jgi:hypothetical protein